MSFSHLNPAGEAHMVDVSAKEISLRTAIASGSVRVSKEVITALRDGSVPKGDALSVARIAGIQAAKRTSDLIPLAHPIALHSVIVELEISDDSVRIRATVKNADRTGVEMEALTAVSVAALALIDMVKSIDPAATIVEVRVDEKIGGKSGHWLRP
jgi:cyclic pyranopterin phosphate synthase